MQIGSLNAKLTATDAGFSATIKKAQSQIGAFSAAMAGGLGIGLGIGAITQAVSSIKAAVEGTISSITSSVERQMDVIDKAAKASDVLGATTESVLELAYAGELAGASFEDVTGAMGKMQKTIGEALSGSKSAGEAFKALGLDAASLSQLQPVAALGKIADALGNLPTKAQQAAAAMDIFGKGAASVMPLLQGGAEGIKSAADEAQALGFAVSRVDAQQVEQANDAVTRLKAFLSGLANTIAVEVAPYITKIINDFVKWATEGGRAKKFVGDALAFIKSGAALLYAQFNAVRGAWNMFYGAILLSQSAVLTVFRTLVEGARAVAGAFGFSSKKLDEMLEKIKKLEKDKRTRGLEKLKGGFSDTFLDVLSMKSIKDAVEWTKEAKRQALDAARAFVAAQKPQGLPPNPHAKEIAEAIERMQQDLAGVTASPIQKVIDKLKELGATPLQIGQAVDLFNAKAIADIFAKLRDDLAAVAGTPLERMIGKLKEAGATASEIAKATARFNMIGLTKFAEDVKAALKSPADAFRETFDQLKEAIGQGLITNEQAVAFANKALGEKKVELSTPPSLLLANSAQALAFQTGANRKTVEDQQLTEQRMMVEELKGIRKNTEQFGPPDVYGGL